MTAEGSEQEVHAIIARLKGGGHDERLARVQGVYRFDVEGVGVWRVGVDRGRVVVIDGTGPADCIIRCEPDDFVRVARGEQNLVTAYMQGLVAIEGDMMLAQVLHGILPSPSKPQAAEPTEPTELEERAR